MWKPPLVSVFGLAALSALCGACSRVPAPPNVDDLSTAPDALASAGQSLTADWRSQVLYLAIPDRFRNGDPSNDNATGCRDPANPHRIHGGDLAGLRANLDYLHELGATALWITPPNKQAGPDRCGAFHGYWIDYADPPDDALAPELGTPDDLAGLSSDLHGRGMRLVLDMVVNHAGDHARIADQHPGWFHPPATCRSLGDPQIFCPLDNHPDFAQEQPAVASYLSAYAQRAVARYHLDGIRMDTAKHVLPSYFHDSFFPAIGATWSLAEIFEEGSTRSFVPYLDAGFSSAFHYPLYAALVAAIGKSGSVDGVASAVAEGISTLGEDRASRLVLFADDHDVGRFTNEPGLGVPEDEIRRRLLLAYDLVFTLPGIPLLYYGDELGMYGGGDPDNRRDLPAWAGDPSQRAQAHPGTAVAGSDLVFARVKQLALLRTTTPALASGAYRELWRQNGGGNPNVFAFSRGTGADTVVVVIGNGGRTTGPVAIPVPLANGTTLVDRLGDGAPANLTVTAGKVTVTLPARSAGIYQIAGAP